MSFDIAFLDAYLSLRDNSFFFYSAINSLLSFLF